MIAKILYKNLVKTMKIDNFKKYIKKTLKTFYLDLIKCYH